MKISYIKEAPLLRAYLLINQEKNKKNAFKSIQTEISKMSEVFGQDFDRNLHLILFNDIDFRDPKTFQKTKDRKIDEKKIKEIKKLKVIHKVINEQFNKTKDKGLKKDKNRESDNLRFSLQSMNDSKMMEMANNFIGDEELNKNEIKEIKKLKVIHIFP